MPFDGRDITPELRRQRLIDALNTAMPEGFAWDFETVYKTVEKCGSVGCALGLASLLWPEQAGMLRSMFAEDGIAAFFGISRDDVNRVFFGFSATYDNDIPTPRAVAEKLAACVPVTSTQEDSNAV